MVRPRSCRVIMTSTLLHLGEDINLLVVSKANVVADALSRKNKTIIGGLIVRDKRELLELAKLGVQLTVGRTGSLMARLVVQAILRERIVKAEKLDGDIEKIRRRMESEQNTTFRILENGMVMMGKRISLPNDKTLKDEILSRAHESKLAVHLESNKMYQDLKEYYWWPKMKTEIAEFLAKCGICQQVKVEHQRPAE